MRIYPKVYLTNKKTKMFISLNNPAKEIKVKILGCEKYLTKHNNYRIDEFERHPVFIPTKINDKLFSLEVTLPIEQKYTIFVEVGEVRDRTVIYALDKDLYELNAYKGDTHLHTSRSDGLLEPKDMSTDYRVNGFDFIVVTDHHIYESSLETRDIIKKLTDSFVVYPGEEIHNMHMGYFHIINIGGNNSVNTTVLSNPKQVDKEVHQIMDKMNYPKELDAYNVAYRTWVANKIKEFDGIATIAHPYWYAYGEYSIQTKDLEYLLKNDIYDAVEMISASDYDDNGNNLISLLYEEMLREGYCKKLAMVGASDSHTSDQTSIYGPHFGLNYTIVFMKDNKLETFKEAIKDQRTVACAKFSNTVTKVYGRYRYSLYARFLIDEYFPTHAKLCEANGKALKTEDKKDILETQQKIDEFSKEFFGKNS